LRKGSWRVKGMTRKATSPRKLTSLAPVATTQTSSRTQRSAAETTLANPAGPRLFAPSLSNEPEAADLADPVPISANFSQVRAMQESRQNQYETLFFRHSKNPILRSHDWPYPINTVFNAGATLLADG